MHAIVMTMKWAGQAFLTQLLWQAPSKPATISSLIDSTAASRAIGTPATSTTHSFGDIVRVDRQRQELSTGLLMEVKVIRIRTHVDDVIAFIRANYPETRPRPIIVAHSFGGAVAQLLLDKNPSMVSGIALLCSVPPSGNGPMASRFIRRDLILAICITLGFVAKKAATWRWLCRKLFFDSELSEEKLHEYMGRFRDDSLAGLDVQDFNKILPSLSADPGTGRARWADRVGRKLVIGAARDNIVDIEGIEETAQFLGTTARILPLPHDIMLAGGDKWRLAAQCLLDWLRETQST